MEIEDLLSQLMLVKYNLTPKEWDFIHSLSIKLYRNPLYRLSDKQLHWSKDIYIKYANKIPIQ